MNQARGIKVFELSAKHCQMCGCYETNIEVIRCSDCGSQEWEESKTWGFICYQKECFSEVIPSTGYETIEDATQEALECFRSHNA